LTEVRNKEPTIKVFDLGVKCIFDRTHVV
jgi:hypothetical protein